LEGVESAEQIRQFGLRMAAAAMRISDVRIVVDEESQMMIEEAQGGINMAHEVHGSVVKEQGAEIDKLQKKIDTHQDLINDSASERNTSLDEHEEIKQLAANAAFFFSGKMLPSGSETEQQATQ
jgi:hypothetical protein